MPNSVEIANIAKSALSDSKAIDIKVIDVRKLTDITDYMVICNGTSDRHTKALARAVLSTLFDNDIKPISTEGEDTGEWIIVDCGDVIIHLMKQEARHYYGLESLWDSRLADTSVEPLPIEKIA